jgi:hypothetical protein
MLQSWPGSRTWKWNMMQHWHPRWWANKTMQMLLMTFHGELLYNLLNCDWLANNVSDGFAIVCELESFVLLSCLQCHCWWMKKQHQLTGLWNITAKMWGTHYKISIPNMKETLLHLQWHILCLFNNYDLVQIAGHSKTAKDYKHTSKHVLVTSSVSLP